MVVSYISWKKQNRFKYLRLGAEQARALAVGGQGPAGEGLLEALRVSEPPSPVSIKRGGGKNRGED